MKRITIHREGRKPLIYTGLTLLCLMCVISFLTDDSYVLLSFTGLSLLVLGAIAFFFRLPYRELVTEDNKVIAPADGKIVVIEEVEEKEYFKDRRIQVSIFMSPANVHVNRAPLSGTVTYQKYHPGRYLVAWHPKSSEKNERNTVVIENEDGIEVLIRQIAGKLARKIRWYLNEGDDVPQGAELGFIKFGSRVDLFLPLGTKIEVSMKQKVKGGITVIGTLPN
ncbi:MAG: phosphatidylserine decarboxylase family protein [Chitinophagales bacterium]|nr:phosphatidylserine decarboxylase family protein [Chitinophagales bacterium]